jgi:hypothetical protein
MHFIRLASLLILAFTATVLAAPGVDNLAERCCACSDRAQMGTRIKIGRLTQSFVL